MLSQIKFGNQEEVWQSHEKDIVLHNLFHIKKEKQCAKNLLWYILIISKSDIFIWLDFTIHEIKNKINFKYLF